jgi:mono/diheme cytochrome c family protein
MGESRASRRSAVVLAHVWCALALLLLLASGCGGSDAHEQPSSASAAQARLMRQGARIFDEHCATCHLLLGRPNTDVHEDFPPGLDLDQVSPSPALARRMVETGGVAMGGFGSTLSAAQQRAVVAYVLEVGGREATVPTWPTRAELEQGRAVYDEQCRRCHVLGGRGGERHNPIWIGTDFDELRPGVIHTERIVREGQFEAMPSFRDRLTLHETRAVALYVNRMARGGPPPDGAP